MITQAYIMGALGKAAFQQDGKWYMLQADEPTLVRPWHPFDNNLLSLSDPEILEVPNPKSIDQLSQLLQIETTKQEALTLALQLMDTSIEHPDLKQRIAVMLGEYVQEETVAQFLENRLLSTPVPSSFQPGFASNLCRSIQQQRMAALYDLLDQHAEDLDSIHVAWVKVSKKNFESNELTNTAYALLVEDGHLAALTRALMLRSIKAWDDAVFNAALAFKKQGIASDARLFAAMKAELAGHFDARTTEVSLDGKSSITEEIERIIDSYLDDLQEQRSGKRSRKDIAKMMRQHGRRGRASGHAEFTNVDGLQKNLDFNIQKITQSLFLDNELQAWQLVRQIIESQIGKSEPKHICKSLCNIAAPVAEIGKYEFARQLLHYALMLNDNDAVVFNQKAEIFKSEGNLNEAKAEYLQIKNRFPQDVVAQNGYAEILKSEGKLSEAKAEYLQIKNRFPHDVFAQNGYAEILKSEGKLSEAKAEYLQIKNRFPDNVVAQNGYAEILKSEGKLSEAKAEYLQIKNRFPQDVVAQTGYAEILKSEGNLSEAKAEYLQIKNRFPDNVVAQNGYAEILKSEGNLSEAKAEYLQIKNCFPQDIVAQHAWYNIHLLLGTPLEGAPAAPIKPLNIQDYYWVVYHINKLMQAGNWEEAQKLAAKSLAQCPFVQFQKGIKQRLWYIQLQTQDLKSVLNEMDIEHVADESPVGQVLRAHVFAASGRVAQANTLLHTVEVHRQISLIPQIGGLLRERYQLEGAPTVIRRHDLLDNEIGEKELTLILMAA